MCSRPSLAEQLEMSGNSKTRASDAIKNQFGDDRNKKIIPEIIDSIESNQVVDGKYSAKSETASCDFQNKSCKKAIASTQVINQVREIDENRSEQSNKQCEQTPETQKSRFGRRGRNKKGKKAAKFKPLMMSFDCPKFTQNAKSAGIAPEEKTTDEFTLMPFDKKANEEEFSLLKQRLRETRCEDPEPFVDLKHAKIYKVFLNYVFFFHSFFLFI